MGACASIARSGWFSPVDVVRSASDSAWPARGPAPHGRRGAPYRPHRRAAVLRRQMVLDSWEFLRVLLRENFQHIFECNSRLYNTRESIHGEVVADLRAFQDR